MGVPLMWSPPLPDCQCGHKFHVSRCGKSNLGCQCREYTESKAANTPDADSDYYMDAIGRRMGG